MSFQIHTAWTQIYKLEGHLLEHVIDSQQSNPNWCVTMPDLVAQKPWMCIKEGENFCILGSTPLDWGAVDPYNAPLSQSGYRDTFGYC